MNRTGKIGRAPKEAREELNRRLAAGMQGRVILKWFNGLPEVQALLAREFEGKAVNEVNLSEWKRGGFKDWAAQAQVKGAMDAVREEAAELAASGPEGMADRLAAWLAARYAVLARSAQEADGSVNLKTLRGICRDVAELRRGDHAEARQRRKQAALELEQERQRKRTEKEMWAWAMQPEIRDRLCQGYLTPEQREARDRAKIDEMRLKCFGVLAEPGQVSNDEFRVSNGRQGPEGN